MEKVTTVESEKRLEKIIKVFCKKKKKLLLRFFVDYRIENFITLALVLKKNMISGVRTHSYL